jgi:hypothetical protein
MGKRSFKAWLTGQRLRKDSVGTIARFVCDDSRILMGAPNAHTVHVRLDQYGLLTATRAKALQKAEAEWRETW